MDYIGEYQFRFRAIPSDIVDEHYLEYDKFPYSIGDRIGQIYLEEIIPIEFEEVETLENTKRGSGGFGSTNKN